MTKRKRKLKRPNLYTLVEVAVKDGVTWGLHGFDKHRQRPIALATVRDELQAQLVGSIMLTLSEEGFV